VGALTVTSAWPNRLWLRGGEPRDTAQPSRSSVRL